MKNKTVAYLRQKMLFLAIFLDRLSKGKIKPNHITLVSFLGHIPVALALISNKPILAAFLLAFFASLDALDGALARVQKSSSLSGMYYDAVSDRAKEIIVFSALAVFINSQYSSNYSWLVAATLGTSILVSYAKAKGEMSVGNQDKIGIDKQKLNRKFSSGLSTYEIRVVLIVVGLVFSVILQTLIILLILNIYTIITRMLDVTKSLNSIGNEGK
jgi:CDP-diacylglycerol--glycerol-3-phosphate 3-phosphatidyltransferase